MRAAQRVGAAVVAGALLLGPPTASAQETPQALRQQIDQLRRDFEALKQQYGDRLTALETRLAAVQGGAPQAGTPQTPAPSTAAPTAPQTAQVPPGAEGAGGPTGTLPVYGATGGAAALSGAKIFNPDIAVIGDFLGAMGRNVVNPDPALQ